MPHPLKSKKPTELRETLFDTLMQASEGDVFLIPHKSGSAILQGEEEYLDLLEQIDTLKAINQGLQDCLDGKTHSHADIKKHLRTHAKKRTQK
jgi:hypothetical protein